MKTKATPGTDARIDTARALQAERLKRNLSVAEAAALCCVSPRTLQGWECGRALPLNAALVVAGFRAIAPRKRAPRVRLGRPPRVLASGGE